MTALGVQLWLWNVSTVAGQQTAKVRPATQAHARYDGEALAVELVTPEMEVEP